MFAGTAGAEERYFEFTGTVTATNNAAIAPLGSTIRGRFHYDDAMVGDYMQDWYALYDVPNDLSGKIDGHMLVTDRTSITIHDFPWAADLVDVYSTPGLMIDDTFHPEGFFGFRLLGNAVQSRNLPSSFDLSQLNYAAGEVMLDGNSTMLAEFSVDNIVNLPPPCLKKNGKPDKNCKHQDKQEK